MMKLQKTKNRNKKQKKVKYVRHSLFGNTLHFRNLSRMLKKALGLKKSSSTYCNCKGGAKGRTVTSNFEYQICTQCGKIEKE